jgi:hypothetical protein
VVDSLFAGQWLEGWGLRRVAVVVLRMAAAALESIADRLEGATQNGSSVTAEDELAPLVGTRARIRDTLDRARNRYDVATLPAATSSRSDRARKRPTKRRPAT